MEKNEYNKIWCAKWGDMQKYGPVHRHHRRIFSLLLKGISYDSVLDVGCGEGSNLKFIKSLDTDKEIKFAGIDISKNAIAQAKKESKNNSFFVMDCQKEKLDKKFALVICSDVVEHLKDDDSAIRNLFEMTEKYCLIATMQGRMRKFEKNIGHFKNYKYGELEEKMKTNGFRIVKKIEWGWPLYSPLYRNLLDFGKVETMTGGKFGILKKTISFILYYIFFINSLSKGDAIFILGERN